MESLDVKLGDVTIELKCPVCTDSILTDISYCLFCDIPHHEDCIKGKGCAGYQCGGEKYYKRHNIIYSKEGKLLEIEKGPKEITDLVVQEAPDLIERFVSLYTEKKNSLGDSFVFLEGKKVIIQAVLAELPLLDERTESCLRDLGNSLAKIHGQYAGLDGGSAGSFVGGLVGGWTAALLGDYLLGTLGAALFGIPGALIGGVYVGRKWYAARKEAYQHAKEALFSICRMKMRKAKRERK